MNLTCQVLYDFLGDYLDGTIPADQRREFEAHLALCPCCRNYLDSYRATVRVCRAAEPATLPQMPPALIQAILASRDQSGS